MALFKDLSDFRRNILFALGGSDEHGNPNLTQDEIRTSLEFLSGINKRMEEKDRPDYGNKQNGWDFAEKLLSVEAQTAVPLDGFIKGTIHLGAK
ncbi:MAG TPA: hypothetical protein VNU45_05195 [Rummeliibacillus sp.]|nr:hypothetical protein [Rummeliibacillus sp.]